MSLKNTIVVPVTPFEQNASIIFCEETNKCAFVDPGGDIDILLAKAKDNNLIPEKILLTHGHIDHAGGASELSEILNIKIEGPSIEDKFLLDSLRSKARCLEWIQGIVFLTYGSKMVILFELAVSL